MTGLSLRTAYTKRWIGTKNMKSTEEQTNCNLGDTEDCNRPDPFRSSDPERAETQEFNRIIHAQV
jgi:hypothetical protein